MYILLWLLLLCFRGVLHRIAVNRHAERGDDCIDLPLFATRAGFDKSFARQLVRTAEGARCTTVCMSVSGQHVAMDEISWYLTDDALHDLDGARAMDKSAIDALRGFISTKFEPIEVEEYDERREGTIDVVLPGLYSRTCAGRRVALKKVMLLLASTPEYKHMRFYVEVKCEYESEWMPIEPCMYMLLLDGDAPARELYAVTRSVLDFVRGAFAGRRSV